LEYCVAEKLIRQLVDDIDGSDAAHTRRFTIDGKNYRIDLSEKNNEMFDKALAQFVENATSERGRPATKAPAGKAKRDYDLEALRAWAAKRKIEIPARGRIPAATVERFKASRDK
jgi:hypothetical protein